MLAVSDDDQFIIDQSVCHELERTIFNINLIIIFELLVLLD